MKKQKWEFCANGRQKEKENKGVQGRAIGGGGEGEGEKEKIFRKKKPGILWR